jgi:hypothetical protein
MNRARLATVSALSVSALSLGLAAPVQAYVRSRTGACNPVYWAQTCVFIQPDVEISKTMPPNLTAAEIEAIIQKSIAAWQDRIGGSFLQLKYMAPNGARETRYDRQPIIKFRTGTWGKPKDCGGGIDMTYDPSAAAITTVYFVDKPTDAQQDGKILDADIELNGVYNQFYDADQGLPPPDGRMPADLQNTLTHELGHLIGLEHTCRIRDTDLPECVKNEQGDRPPLCGSAASRAFADTAMYAVAAPGETKKRIPKPDDIAGVVAAYPAQSDPRICEAPKVMDPCAMKGTGCGMAGPPAPPARGGSGGVLLLVGLAAAVGLLGWRRVAPVR